MDPRLRLKPLWGVCYAPTPSDVNYGKFTWSIPDPYPGISAWDITCIVYLTVVGGYFMLTLRPGYVGRLRAKGRLRMGFLDSCSDGYLVKPTNLQVPMRTFLLNIMFWMAVLGMKGLFDWFAVVKPLKKPVSLLYSSTPGQPVLGVLLAMTRVLPTFLACLFDTGVFYSVAAALAGIIKGYFHLNLGWLVGFEDIRANFSSAAQSYAKQSVAVRTASMAAGGSKMSGLKSMASGMLKGLGSRTASVPAHNWDKPALDEEGGDFAVLAANKQQTWGVTSAAWNEIVKDLRKVDYLSDEETASLSFVDMCAQLQRDKAAKDLQHLNGGILMPSFIRAGLVETAVRTDSPSSMQIATLLELRDWLLWLAKVTAACDAEAEDYAQLRECLHGLKPVMPAPSMQAQQQRIAAIAHGRLLLKLIRDLPSSMESQQTTASMARAVAPIYKQWACLARVLANELELCNAHQGPRLWSLSRRKATTMNTRVAFMTDMTRRLEAVAQDLEGGHWAQRSMQLIFLQDDLKLKRMVARQLERTLDPMLAGLQPKSSYALHVLRFFLGSLKDASMKAPDSMEHMRSLTTLIPHYKECVMYPISAESVAHQLDMDARECKGLDDLVSTRYNSVSLMSYLRSVYPHEWHNFKERMQRECRAAKDEWPYGLEVDSLSEINFDKGQPLYHKQQQLTEWASNRGQLLFRTVRGMACYHRAIRFHAKATTKHRWGNPEIDYLVSSKYSCVVTSQMYGEDKRYSVLAVGSTTEGKAPTEAYRIRLPSNAVRMQNGTPNPGIILGEGKPENQNHATIFCFGEVLQAIDMNQDGNFAEALKVPNILKEFDAGDAQQDNVALVGFREWIFSEDAGAPAAFAASTEFAFSTIAQRVMASPGAVRFHYGHPDMWNKLWTMTRGGISKATKGFHISEDVFAGYNHVLRGGKVKFREYISVGKGRDMGFDAINSFEAKVASGNGEQVFSREIHRLGKHLDFFRLMSFYQSGPGFYINTYLIMVAIYAAVWSSLLIVMTGKQNQIDGLGNLFDVITGKSGSGITVLQLVQLGMLSVVLYFAESALERGFFRTIGIILWQLLTGSLLFLIFRGRTSAYYFFNDVIFGGAKYIATGREFALERQQFVKMYSRYAFSHFYWGAELMLMLILLATMGMANYWINTFGSWIVVLSLLCAPVWFNPNSFSLNGVRKDFAAWRLWMQDGMDRGTNTTWFMWHQEQLRRRSRLDNNQPNVMGTAVYCIATKLPSLFIAGAAVQWGLPDGCEFPRSCTRWGSYGIFTAALVVVLAIVAGLCKAALRWRRMRRLISTVLILAFVALVAAYFAVFRQHYATQGSHIYVWMFLNLEIIAWAAAVIMQLEAFIGIRTGRSVRWMQRFVTSVYRSVDWIMGSVYFVIMLPLAFIRMAAIVQSVLLFNVSYSQALLRGKFFKGFYMKDWVDYQIGQQRQQQRSDLLDTRDTTGVSLRPSLFDTKISNPIRQESYESRQSLFDTQNSRQNLFAGISKHSHDYMIR
ncbi:hypothetical protein WJX73_004893 [Symbiochloris irregularis]|uniref:Glycosyl transferase 48 domain-containing protein n=1 Tax=Symbiochloris irregularis TaxID=706552 RepID=A0AAW1PR19_9CHLO